MKKIALLLILVLALIAATLALADPTIAVDVASISFGTIAEGDTLPSPSGTGSGHCPAKHPEETGTKHVAPSGGGVQGLSP